MAIHTQTYCGLCLGPELTFVIYSFTLSLNITPVLPSIHYLYNVCVILYITLIQYQPWIHIAYATPSHTLTSTPLLDYSSIKVHRVFLSHNHSLTYLHITPLFLHHLYVTQTPICSILHAGRYLNDKEICYLGTVILTANVYHFTQETLVTYQLQSFNIYF